jgi:hypothetical protein
MTYVVIYAYICGVEDIVIVMIGLIDHSKYSVDGLNPNINFLKNKYGNEDLEIYFNLATKLLHGFNNLTQTTTEQKIMQFEAEKNIYLAQKNKIKYDMENKQNYWDLTIPTEVYERFNSLDNKNKLNANINLSDYLSDKNKKGSISEIDIDTLLTLFNGLGIISDRNGIMRFIRFYNEIKNQVDKLKNADNIPTNSNDLEWFKQNVPVNVSTDPWTNIKKAFIYGFGIFNVAIFHSNSRKIFDFNGNKDFVISETSVSEKSNFMVYLFKERTTISIIINTDIETLAECTLFNYNPFMLSEFDVTKVPETSTTENNMTYFINQYMKILKLKYKFIAQLITKQINSTKGKKFEKLLSKPNNLIEYIVNLWTRDFNTNIYGSLFNGYTRNRIK